MVIYFLAAHSAPLSAVLSQHCPRSACFSPPRLPSLCTENEESCCGLAEHCWVWLPDADLSREKGTSPNQVQNIKRHRDRLPTAANRENPHRPAFCPSPVISAAPPPWWFCLFPHFILALPFSLGWGQQKANLRRSAFPPADAQALPRPPLSGTAW